MEEVINFIRALFSIGRYKVLWNLLESLFTYYNESLSRFDSIVARYHLSS